jgi:hypothetical protein
VNGIARGGATPADILVVSVPTTSGWRAAAEELARAFERAGARVARVETGSIPDVRTFALTDFVQARAARAACLGAIACGRARAIVYCSTTAALLWPRPGAIWLDAVAAENRPGRHGVWQRIVERRRLAEAPALLTMSPRALAGAPEFGPRATVVPVPVRASGPPAAVRDIDAVTYAANPAKKRVDYVLAAWERARRAGETLVVAGLDGLAPREGIDVAGRLPPAEYRALLRRARAFVAAPTREDYGIAPLEALADGCQLVSTPAPGGYPALDLARALDPRLVGEDLDAAIRTALDDPVPDYAERARDLLVPYTFAAVDRVIAEDVLPRLLPGWPSQ